jgi:dTDP-4-amino-4,6-dideoxygalactose transaminase
MPMNAQTLAIEGGVPVRSQLLSAEQDYFDDAELNAVTKVMKSKVIRRGEVTVEFEKKIADWIGVKRAIAVTSGTTALHIAMAALDIGPGDEVIVAPYTFVSSATCVLEQNAIPVFADIDPDYLHLDLDDIERKITPYTKAIIPVSAFGAPVDIDPIMDLAKKHGLWVVEDDCRALGAIYKGRKVGSTADISIFSTVAGKVLSTGEGGFVVTNNEELFEKMWGYSDFARKRSLGNSSKYNFGLPCTNYRITNLQSAIGIEQLKKLDRLVEIRNKNARYLNDHLKNVNGISIPKETSWGETIYYYYLLRIHPEILGTDLLNFAVALSAEGVFDKKLLPTTRFPISQNLEPLFINKSGYGRTKCPFECSMYKGSVQYGIGQCPVSEKAHNEVLWLSSLNPLMTFNDLDDIVNAVKKVTSALITKKNNGIPVNFATETDKSML